LALGAGHAAALVGRAACSPTRGIAGLALGPKIGYGGRHDAAAPRVPTASTALVMLDRLDASDSPDRKAAACRVAR
jgi:hypothetical protein